MASFGCASPEVLSADAKWAEIEYFDRTEQWESGTSGLLIFPHFDSSSSEAVPVARSALCSSSGMGNETESRSGCCRFERTSRGEGEKSAFKRGFDTLVANVAQTRPMEDKDP